MERNDRVTAIVGRTLIEVNVEELLRRFLRAMSSDEESVVFSGVGPLTAFANKTRGRARSPCRISL